MKRSLAPFALLLAAGLAGVPLVAQNTQTTQQPSHVLTDEDMQQRYHNDSTTSDSTDTSTTDQTDKNTQVSDPSDQGNDAESLKKQLAKKEKELAGVKGSLNALQVFKESTQKKLDSTSDADYKVELQNQLDENAKDTATAEAREKQLEKQISELKDQVKDTEANDNGSTTEKTSNENNSNTENKDNNQNPQR